MARRSQPYHRAGSIDCNARYAVETANFLQMADRKRNKPIFGPPNASDNQLSILVGEPLYTPKRQRLCDERPTNVISSLNGFSMLNTADMDRFTDAVRAAIESDSGGILGKLRAYSKLRDIFFEHVAYTGVSIDVWDRGEKMQGDRIAITHGGLNTVECNAPFIPGDLVIADMPWSEEFEHDNKHLAMNGGNGVKQWLPHGLTYPKHKSGKIMLSIVPMPRRPPEIRTEAELKAWVQYQNGFFARGQVMGRCTEGNQLGIGTIDLIMGTCVGGQC
jgi:hypothetical protein